MLDPSIDAILTQAATAGWVFEPEAKRLLKTAGLDTPAFIWTRDLPEAKRFARRIGYPVVAKIVSSQVIHKTEAGGVVTGIGGDTELERVFRRFYAMDGFEGILVEETLAGVELIVGAKMDDQFGPVVLLGIGGIAVEVYQDVSVRMAPLEAHDIPSMIDCLKGRRLISGFRGTEPVNMEKLSCLLLDFSALVMHLAGRFASIDLNPVICDARRCTVADARIMLDRGPTEEPPAGASRKNGADPLPGPGRICLRRS